MPGRVWELRDIKLGSGGNPPDTIITRIPHMQTTPKEAREHALRLMRQHVRNRSSVEGIVIADGDGNTIARVTAWDVSNA